MPAFRVLVAILGLSVLGLAVYAVRSMSAGPEWLPDENGWAAA